MLFCRDIRICRDLRTFLGDFGQKNVFYFVKNSDSWARTALIHGILFVQNDEDV